MKKKLFALSFTFSLTFASFNSFAQENHPGAGNALSYTTNTNSIDVGLIGGWANSSVSTFSVEQWVMFNTLNAGQTVISRYQGSPPGGTFGWVLYMRTPGTLGIDFNNSQITNTTISFPGVVINQMVSYCGNL